MAEHEHSPARRRLIQAGMATAAVTAISGPSTLFAQPSATGSRTASRGYAALDASGVLRPWTFERRAVGDSDILIDVKFASICHSDIHQMRGDWGPQQYPQVPGHEIVGVVSAVGTRVTKFKVGDRAGVGCMVDSCMRCPSCLGGQEHHCDNHATVFTYGSPDKNSPSGITQGGYSTNIVVRDHFAVHIPENIRLEDAAPLLCAGITCYSPLMRARFTRGDRVGVSGIGGLGHMAVKLAVAKGAEVHAFTTSPQKIADIRKWGAKEVVVVDDIRRLAPHRGTLDYMISTIPVQFDVGAYASTVKPGGSFTLVGMANRFSIELNNLALAQARVNFNASLIGGIPETQEVVSFCADNRVLPQIEIISANQINDAWTKVVGKQARYRYVIDAATF